MWKLKILVQYKKSFKYNSLILQNKEKLQNVKNLFIFNILLWKKIYNLNFKNLTRQNTLKVNFTLSKRFSYEKNKY